MTDEFTKGDRLASAGDRCALEYGWWAWAWIRAEAEAAGERGGEPTGALGEVYPDSRADPDSRAALSYGLGVLESHHGRWLSASQIADRVRIGKAFPRKMHLELKEELHYEFSFSQLRAAYIRDEPAQTMELLLWAAETNATPQQIQAKKMGGDPETDESRAWRNLVIWAEKYLARSGGVEPERDRVAAGVVKLGHKNKCDV